MHYSVRGAGHGLRTALQCQRGRVRLKTALQCQKGKVWVKDCITVSEGQGKG